MSTGDKNNMGDKHARAAKPAGPTSGDLDAQALFFHRYPHPASWRSSRPSAGNQRDLALAYSPGVAAPCLAIRDDRRPRRYTARANLVAVVSNGSAVLGLGNIGPLASKPVMEGKAVLFKKFAGIDVFDIEIDAPASSAWSMSFSALEPTFGGINLEDIKAPECFEVERRLRETMNIPVFHDDQHGTAIIVAAAVLNGLELAARRSRMPRSSPRAQVRPRSPASTCSSISAPGARTSGCTTSKAWSMRARGADGSVEVGL